MISLFLKGILIILCGILWRLGGKEQFSKAYRRIGCALIIITNALIMKNWLGLISLPLLIGAFSVGYGKNSKLMKLLKNPYLVRFVCGSAYSMASIPILLGNWWLLAWHLITVPLWTMICGNQKFQFEDEREEFSIGLLVGLCPIVG